MHAVAALSDDDCVQTSRVAAAVILKQVRLTSTATGVKQKHCNKNLLSDGARTAKLAEAAIAGG